VIDDCSDLLVEGFGDRGRHARSVFEASTAGSAAGSALADGHRPEPGGGLR
jgi:hypothetical protein